MTESPAKKRLRVVPAAPHGNYPRYYASRLPTSGEDSRLAQLKDEWFRGKK